MANPLLFVPLTVTGSIAVVLLPDISALAVKNDYTTLNKRVDLGMNFSFLICGLVMGLFLSLGEELTSFLYGDTESGKYLSVAAFSMLPMCLSQMSQSILNSVGKEKQAFFSFLAGNACMLVLIYVLPKYVGIYGMAIATCASYLVDGTINCVLLHKKTGWGRNAIKYLVLSVLFSLICAFFTLSLRSLTGALAPFLSLFIKGFCCVVSYATLCAGAGLIDINLFWALCKKKKAR